MKHLLTLVIWVASSLAMAQFPSLPYNPDENGDGLIGVSDLQGLLSNYGSEFTGAITNSGVALIRLEDAGRIACATNCANLTGPWKGLVWETAETHFDLLSELLPVSTQYTPGPQNYAWVDSEGSSTVLRYYLDEGVVRFGGSTSYDTEACICQISERPKIEWSYCEHYGNGANDELPSAIAECYNQKLDEGWYPLGSPSVGHYSISQSFWRWAE